MAKTASAPSLLGDDTATVQQQTRIESQGVPLVREMALVPADSANLVLMFERLARDKDVDPVKLEKLIDLQERILKHNAESAFNTAFSEMQAKLPTIVERSKTDKATYAPLEDIVDAVRPILREFGFSLSFQTEWPDKATVKVIGILTHRDGHARRSEFQAGADQTGSKNAIQALASSVSYGRRYTAKDLLCIVTRGEDDDGEDAGLSNAPDAPEGYEAFAACLEDLAKDGLAELTKAFSKAKPEFRNYLTKHHMKAWLAIKQRAEKVGRGNQ